MTFTILGSGGCVSIPKPLCRCRVCTEAREKGYPRARCGCSLYCDDIKALIDTPEDISIAINNAKLTEINTILYTHTDPDHTLEACLLKIRLELLDYFVRYPTIKLLILRTLLHANLMISSNRRLFLILQRMGLIQPYMIKPRCPSETISLPLPRKRSMSLFVFERTAQGCICSRAYWFFPTMSYFKRDVLTWNTLSQ